MKRTYADGVLEGYSKCLQHVYSVIDRVGTEIKSTDGPMAWSHLMLTAMSELIASEQVKVAHDSIKSHSAVTPCSSRDHELCKRCGHPQEWHTHDDHDCLSKHPQPCSPDTAPFRCLGYDCMGEGFPAGTPESRCGCADFIERIALNSEGRRAVHS